MLKRLYVHNFRTLINFEVSFDRINLLLGPNGSGKSSVFDVLFKIRHFVTQDGSVAECFPLSGFTCWAGRSEPVQGFELEIAGNGGTYVYKLTIEHDPEGRRARVGQESLSFDGKPLFEFSAKTGDAQVYHDSHAAGPKYPLDWSRSGVGFLHSRPDNVKLTWFKRCLARVIVVRPNPALMGAETRDEVTAPAPDLSDLASWFRYLVQERQGQVFRLTEKLRGVLEGFDTFRLATAGEAKLLSAGFRTPPGDVHFFKLHDLSDGQRVLMALYALLYCLPEDTATLCVDEPENFLALPEIQPWLDELEDCTQARGGQALLISHHPRLINFLASDAGLWFSRDDGTGPTRIKRITDSAEETGLAVSQLVERGWIVDD